MNRLISSDQTGGEIPAMPGRLPMPGAWVVGRLHGTRVAISWSLPGFAALALLGGWLLRGQPGNADLPLLAAILAVAMFAGAMLQGAVRLVAAQLLGATSEDLTLHAFGAWGRVRGLAGGRRMLLALTAPLGSLVVAALLASVPPGGAGWAGFSFVPSELVGQLTAVAVLTSCVWLLLIQAAAQAIPLPHCHGREWWVGLVEWATPQLAVAARQRLLRRLLGGIAVLLLAAGLALFAMETPADGIPRWPFLVVLATAVWATRGQQSGETFSPVVWSPAPLPLAIQRMPVAATPQLVRRRRRRSGPRLWLVRCWGGWRVRAAQRRERLEAVDAQRLDLILDRLHRDGINSLASEERAVLRRVSERLRKMQRDAARRA